MRTQEAVLGRERHHDAASLVALYPTQEDKCDIKALIEFESVVKGDRGDKLNALRFNILVEDV